MTDNTGKTSIQRKHAPCAQCGKTATIQGRGLCSSCYYHARKAENTKPKPTAVRRPPPKPERAPTPETVHASPETPLLVIPADMPRAKEIIEALNAAAKQNFRTPPHEAAHILYNQLMDGGFIKPQDAAGS